MAMINTATVWFEISEVPMYNLNKVMGGNNEYIDKSSARVSPLFNNVWLSRYTRPCKVLFDNGSKFKQ